MANNRRILRSEASNNVQRAWRDLLAERLKDKDMDIDVESVLEATSPSYVCRKCFKSIEAFHERKSQLLSKFDSVIEKILNTSITVSGLSESSADPLTPSRQLTSRKRSSPGPYPEQRSKFPRISANLYSAAPSSSPGVQVRILLCVV